MPRLKQTSAGFSFICAGCGEKTNSLGGFADLDGKAFKAYYCQTCAAILRARSNKLNNLNGQKED